MAVADLTPPRLTALTFPTLIDASTYSSPYFNTYPVFTVGAADDGTGVDHVTITLDRARYAYGGGDIITIGGSRALFEEGPQSQAVTFGPDASSGTYGIAGVAVYDRAGNVATYSPSQLTALGIATSFTVTSPTAEDRAAPTLTALGLPGTIDVRQGGAMVTVLAYGRDIGSGLYTAQLTIDHGIGTQTLYRNGDAANGNFTLYSNAAPGTYHVTAATLTDYAGNSRSYDAAQLAALQVNTSFTVVSDAVADTTAPVLTSLTVPASINLAAGNALAQIRAGITETGSGVARIVLALDHGITLAFPEYYPSHSTTPTGGPVLTSSLSAATSGSSYSGLLSLSQTGSDYAITYAGNPAGQVGIPFSALTADGTYHVTGAAITDKAGNSSFYTADQLAALGANTTISIVADGTAPALTGFSVSPIVTNINGNLGITATTTDTGTGAAQLIVHTSRALPVYTNSGYDANHLAIGSFTDGRANYNLQIPFTSAIGSYDISDVILRDGGGNSTVYTADQLRSMGFSTSFNVTNGRSPADFDGNGLSDILWRNVSGAVSVWSTDGGGARERVTQDTFDARVAASWHPVETFDWNGDNHADILWRNDNGGLAIWTGRTGDFAQGAYLDFSVSTIWQIAATGDFNGDGRDDILWRNADGSISSWLAFGNNSFSQNAYFHSPVGTGWQIEGAGDFNGDGKSDILWRNANGAVSVWNSNGNGFEEGSVLHAAVDRSWHIDGIGDFNGDGRDDILWRNDNGQLTVWQGNGGSSGFDEACFNATAPIDWHIAAVGDYSGEHLADILWRNDAGAISIWNSNGAGWQQNTYFDAGAGRDWSIIAHDYLF